LDFTLPEQLETLNFGDCYDQNLSRLIMPSGVKSLTLPFTRFFHMQLGELELPGGMARLPHVYHVLHAASRVFMDYGLHYVAWLARRRRSCFYGSKHRDFTQKKPGGSAPKMEI
jgi:hypothetical protein